jgi:hypothetical protein
LQDPSKFTQIWIFGLKKYHLATLIEGKISKLFSAMPKFMPKLNCCVFYKKKRQSRGGFETRDTEALRLLAVDKII